MLKSICLLCPLYLFLPKLLEFDSNFLGCIPAFLHNSLHCWSSFTALSSFNILSTLSSMYVLWATVSATSVSSYWFSFAFFSKVQSSNQKLASEFHSNLVSLTDPFATKKIVDIYNRQVLDLFANTSHWCHKQEPQNFF